MMKCFVLGGKGTTVPAANCFADTGVEGKNDDEGEGRKAGRWEEAGYSQRCPRCMSQTDLAGNPKCSRVDPGQVILHF